MRKMVIVNAGRWGEVKPEEYTVQAKQLEEDLEELVAADNKWREKTSGLEPIETRIVIADSTESAVKEFEVLDTTGAIIFLTRDMCNQAEMLATRNQKLVNQRVRMIVLTGLVPDDRVLYFGKTWGTRDASVTEMMFSSM